MNWISWMILGGWGLAFWQLYDPGEGIFTTIAFALLVTMTTSVVVAVFVMLLATAFGYYPGNLP